MQGEGDTETNYEDRHMNKPTATASIATQAESAINKTNDTETPNTNKTQKRKTKTQETRTKKKKERNSMYVTQQKQKRGKGTQRPRLFLSDYMDIWTDLSYFVVYIEIPSERKD